MHTSSLATLEAFGFQRAVAMKLRHQALPPCRVFCAWRCPQKEGAAAGPLDGMPMA